MIYILDSEQKIIGHLSNDAPNGTPYYDDLHVHKIADDNVKSWNETFTIKVPSQYPEAEMLVFGNHLLIEAADGKYKLFTIDEVGEQINGVTHLTTVDVAYNTFMVDMRNYNYIQQERVFNPAMTPDIIKYLCAGVGWDYGELSELYNGAARTFTVKEGNALTSLDEFIQTFDLQIDAYVEVKNGQIASKQVRFFKTPDTLTYTKRFEYKRNLTGAERSLSSNDFYTMLYVYTMADNEGNRKPITAANKIVNPYTGQTENLPYLYDKEANDKYNNGKPYIIGVIQSDTLGTEEAAVAWGKKQLEYYNHPKYTYSVDLALLEEMPALGERILVVDLDMTPQMAVIATVIETEISTASPQNNKIELGEYNTVEIRTIDTIAALQDQIKYLNKKTPTYTIDDYYSEPQTDGENVILKVVVREDGVKIDLPPEAYVWKRYVVETSVLDEEWGATGAMIEVTPADFDAYYYVCSALIAEYDLIIRQDFKTAMTNYIKRISKYLKEDNIVIGFSTDGHYDNDNARAETKDATARTLQYENNVIELSNHISMDAIVECGDVIDGRKADRDVAKINLDSAIGMYRNAKAPRIILRGNHDTNYLFYKDGGATADKYNADGFIPNEQAYNIFSQFWDQDGIVTDDNKNGIYGYYDVPNKNTRLIFLDSIDLNEKLNNTGINLLPTHSATPETLTFTGSHAIYGNNELIVDGVNVRAGDTITFRAKVKTPATPTGIYGTARIFTYTAAGVQGGNNALAANRVAPNGEGYTFVTYTIPQNVIKLAFGFANATNNTGATLQISEAKAEIGATHTPYDFVQTKRAYTALEKTAYSEKQLKFLADALIDLPENQDVVIFTHVALTRPNGATNEEINKQLVIDIINMYRTGGTRTFTSNRRDYEVNFTRTFPTPTGRLIALIAGHNHADTAERDVLINGIIPSFTRTCLFNGDQDGRPLDTLDETAFDTIVINKKNTSIRFLRFGHGLDKVANYISTDPVNEDNDETDEGASEND